MSRHVIIGKGNLGMDLYLALKQMGHKACVKSKSSGFLWPDSLPDLLAENPTHVWVTAGAGSVEQCQQNPGRAIDTHVRLPLELCARLPREVKICLFSTDYVADENKIKDPLARRSQPQSFYALTKLMMEMGVQQLQRPRIAVVRVGSLYGVHFYERTLPGRLETAFPEPSIVSLPMNHIGPTPTSYIARVLAANQARVFLDWGPTFHHLGPSVGMTVLKFGQLVLGGKHTYQAKALDSNRPYFSEIGNSITGEQISAEELWMGSWRDTPRVDQPDESLIEDPSDGPQAVS